MKDLFRALPEGATLLARCAKNRALYELPGPSAHKNRKYADRAKRPSEWLEKGRGRRRKGWRTGWVTVRGRAVRLVHRVEGPYLLKGAPERPVYLIVVKGADQRAKSRRRREPSFFLVSAAPKEDGGWSMPFSAEELLFWAWQRWEVEVAHREMKSSFGLGEIQCWGSLSTVMATRWQAWAYGVMVLAGLRAWGLGKGPASAPAGPVVGRLREVVSGDALAGIPTGDVGVGGIQGALDADRGRLPRKRGPAGGIEQRGHGFDAGIGSP